MPFHAIAFSTSTFYTTNSKDAYIPGLHDLISDSTTLSSRTIAYYITRSKATSHENIKAIKEDVIP